MVSQQHFNVHWFFLFFIFFLSAYSVQSEFADCIFLAHCYYANVLLKLFFFSFSFQQAVLVLNASRRFRYTLDLKQEEEKERIRRKLRAHAQVIRVCKFRRCNCFHFEKGTRDIPHEIVFSFLGCITFQRSWGRTCSQKNRITRYYP